MGGRQTNESRDNNLEAQGSILCYPIAGLHSLTGFLSLAAGVDPGHSWQRAVGAGLLASLLSG